MLNPPKNIRTVHPKSCAFCKYNVQIDKGDGLIPVCERDKEEDHVVIYMHFQYHTVCDYFKR